MTGVPCQLPGSRDSKNADDSSTGTNLRPALWHDLLTYSILESEFTTSENGDMNHVSSLGWGG